MARRITLAGFLVLALLGLSAMACGSLPSFPTRVQVVGHHISGLTLHNGDLYFGAGYCLYHLDTQSRDLDEILCTDAWTFQRPAIDDQKAYVQVVTSPEGAHFFVSVDLATGATDWYVDHLGTPFRRMKDHVYLVDDRVVIVWSEVGEQRVCAFDSQSGQQAWCTEPNYLQLRPLPFLIHEGSLWYAIEGSKGYDDKDGQLVAVDLETGLIQQTIDLRPVITFDDLLYVDADWILGWENEQGIFAIDRHRPDEVSWYGGSLTKYASDQVSMEDSVFIVGGAKAAYGLDRETGQTIWEFTPDGVNAHSQNTDSLALLVLGVGESRMLYALDVASGAAVWQYPLESEDAGFEYAWQVDSPSRPVVDGDTAYIANGSTINALDLITGELLWKVNTDSEYRFYVDPLDQRFVSP
jgi:outer membrane protein assembly factor BamB